MEPRVRMLCKRSAILIRMTRMSFDMVSSNFLKFSACAEARSPKIPPDILVSPSTIWAVSYTHLDVYKRQFLANQIYKLKNLKNIVNTVINEHSSMIKFSQIPYSTYSYDGMPKPTWVKATCPPNGIPHNFSLSDDDMLTYYLEIFRNRTAKDKPYIDQYNSCLLYTSRCV